jgi:flagellar export protein FliJ
MKNFRFRFDQALRWRSAQVDAAKTKVAAAANRLSTLRAELESLENEWRAGANHLSSGASGPDLQSWAVYSRRVRADLAAIGKQIQDAERTLGEELGALVEADRKLRLLENLKQTERTRWNADFDRETETFSGDAFLVRYNRESTRARSSGG